MLFDSDKYNWVQLMIESASAPIGTLEKTIIDMEVASMPIKRLAKYNKLYK